MLAATLASVLVSPAMSTMLGGIGSSSGVDDRARQAASLAVTKLNSDQAVRSAMLGSGLEHLTLVCSLVNRIGHARYHLCASVTS